MEIKTLLRFRVPSHYVPAIVLHFPLHQGDKLRDVIDRDTFSLIEYYIDHWHVHKDQIQFLMNNGIDVKPENAAAPVVAYDRYTAYAEAT